MSKPQQFRARLANKEEYNEKFTKYIFELVEPHELEFAAGQFVSIKVSDAGDRRSYSICNNPDNLHGFELLIDHSPEGLGTTFLKNLEFGSEITGMGPLGRFMLKEDNDKDELVFVATGSGIAPFRSMILDLLQDRNEKRPITLYWGLRYTQNLFWENEFQDLVESYENFKFHPVLSRAADEWSLCRGRVTDCLSIHTVPMTAAYYLCGSAGMIADVKETLQGRGVAEQNIYFEKFY